MQEAPSNLSTVSAIWDANEVDLGDAEKWTTTLWTTRMLSITCKRHPMNITCGAPCVPNSQSL